jgi:acetolactate synthase-1/2/3 large subunit
LELSMEKITGGHLLIQALKAHGIRRLFTLPGAPLFPVYEACLNEGIEVFTARHESGLIHIAEGWSRATGNPSVVLVSPGPGLANSVPGTSIAFAECSPVIVLSGIDAPANLGRGGRQELPQVAMCAPITKWAALLSNGSRIPEYIAKAFRISMNGMPGPVHISITRWMNAPFLLRPTRSQPPPRRRSRRLLSKRWLFFPRQSGR